MARNKDRQSKQSSSAYVQILGTGMDTHDTFPSILLFFDNIRIIFNAGEGLQRFCAEHKVKLSKIDYICLTRVCSETVGGLPGLLLTLAGLGGGHSVKLRGPSDLKSLAHAFKSFIPHAAICADSFGFFQSSNAQSPTVPCLSEGPFLVCEHKNVVKISAVLLQPSFGEDDSVKPSDTSVVYICELAEIKGKFHSEKAEALGLKAGPKREQLRNGKSVKSDCLDIMVNPSDVMDPPIQGSIILIVDCPTECHAEKLYMTLSLSNYYAKFPGEGSETVTCVVHLTPASVVNHTNYQKWMRKLGTVEHIMAGYSMKNVGIPILKSSARITNRLSYLCPQFFPPPALQSPEYIFDAEVGTETNERIHASVLAENLLKFTLLPRAQLGLDKSNVPGLVAPLEVIGDLLLEIPEVVATAQQISQFWSESKGAEGNSTENDEGSIRGSLLDQITLPSCLENIRRDDAEIVLLGTGSSQPSKYRNVSSIFVNLFSKGSLLLDCGEGTLAQLKRRYGMEVAANAIRNLRCIWISHIHADHHAGLVRILALRRDLLKGTPHDPLHVIGPKFLESFLSKYKILEDLDMQFLDCRSTTAASWDTIEQDNVLMNCQTLSDSMKDDTVNDEDKDDSCLLRCSKRQKLSVHMDDCLDFGLLKSLSVVLNEVGLERLTSFPVEHCPQSFGVILKAKERVNNVGALIPGWKIVYSGDTRPCTEVIQASIGATLLIHEATFEDSLADEAIARNHSTIQEAMEVGNSAGAYRIILTHFSQRYPKIPSFDEIDLKKASVAFDLMSVNLADLPILPLILPYLKLLFRDDVIEKGEDDYDLCY